MTKIKDKSDCGTLFFSDDSLEPGACLSTPDIVAMVLRGNIRPEVRYVVRTPGSLTNQDVSLAALEMYEAACYTGVPLNRERIELCNSFLMC